jgi:hypothetical protein
LKLRAIAAVFLAAITIGCTATVTAVPAIAVTPAWSRCGPVWCTRQAGAMLLAGPYRISDNAWVGNRRLAASSNGVDSISIRSQARPGGANVVAYPSVIYGGLWGYTDPQAGGPWRVRHLGTMTLNVRAAGHASGVWLTDVDAWFHPDAASVAHAHGTFELVISNRSSSPETGGDVVRIHGHRFTWAEWITCQRNAAGACTAETWPILVMHEMRPSVTAHWRLGAFVWFARHHGLPGRDWLGDVGYGTELVSGGRGLTDTLTVTYPRQG